MLEKKKSLPEVSEPALKRKTQAPARYFFGKTPAEHPLTSRDHYRKIYFEAVNLLVGQMEDRFQQPRFQIYQRLESLLLDSLNKDIQCLNEDITYVRSIYDEVDTQSLPAQLELFRTMIGNQKLTFFNEIHTAAKVFGTHERSAICNVITIMKLLHVNPCSSASRERTFSTARRINTWLRANMNQKCFNSVAILNQHNSRTDKINIVDISNSFVCNVTTTDNVILESLRKRTLRNFSCK